MVTIESEIEEQSLSSIIVLIINNWNTEKTQERKKVKGEKGIKGNWRQETDRKTEINDPK